MSGLNERPLTSEQKRAVVAPYDRYTVVAGAGSGKTTVLAHRFVRLVHRHGIGADEVLTLTFTRFAAAEMKRRIVRLLRQIGEFEQAQVAETGPIQTLDSFFESLLRENAMDARIDPEFRIEDEGLNSALRQALQITLIEFQDQQDELISRFLAECAGETRYEFSRGGNDTEYAQQLTTDLIDASRSSGWDPDHLEFQLQNPEALMRKVHAMLDGNPSMKTKLRNEAHLRAFQDVAELTAGLVRFSAQVWRRMISIQAETNSYDFATIATMALRLLQGHPHVRERVRRQYRALLVDESQDLSALQREFIDTLDIERVMFVGDVNQSIYGFRFAKPEQFRKEAESGRQLHLTRNFRATTPIISFVDRAFANLWGGDYKAGAEASDDPFGSATYEGVELWPFESLKMADAVSLRVAGMVHTEGVRPGDIAVLVPANFDAANVMSALRKHGIDAHVTGGRNFHQRLVVRDIANILECICRPTDDFALAATLRGPSVSMSLDGVIGATLYGDRTLPLRDRLREYVPAKQEDVDKLASFFSWFDDLARNADRVSAWECLGQVFARSPLLPNLAALPNAGQSIANARKLLMVAGNQGSLRPREFVERIRMIQKSRENLGDAKSFDSQSKSVTVSTIHAAKGLEFPNTVVVFGADKKRSWMDGVIFDAERGIALVGVHRVEFVDAVYKQLSEQRNIEEKWRQSYVALTRAKERLILAFPMKADKPPQAIATLLKPFGGLKGLDPSIKVVQGETPYVPEE